jgi:hypothetical protein
MELLGQHLVDMEVVTGLRQLTRKNIIRCHRYY